MKSKFRPNEEEKDFIFENYIGVGNKELAEMFNKKFGTDITTQNIKTYKANHRLNSGLTGRFEKGQKSWNKGLKWNDFMSKEAQANSSKTTFKKGNKPINERPVGSTFVDKDGYLYIKVKNEGKRFGRGGKWQPYHHLVWIAYNGEMPEGTAIVFLDRNLRNFDIDNLILITRAELARINNNKNYGQDKDINLSVVALSKLIDKYQRIIKE